MNYSAYKISLDINEHGSQAVLKAKKTDTGRMVYISLRAGGMPYIIADDCYAVFAATKPDGSILYNACTIEGNEIAYEFTEQTCAAVGRIRCEIKLYGLDDMLITSPRFTLLVDGTVYPDGTVESTDEFSALTQIISDTIDAAKNATQAAADATKATATAENATEATIQATASASVAAAAANQAVEVASEATSNAYTATGHANNAAERANNAADSATIATQNANAAAASANEASQNATMAANNANKAAHTAKNLMVVGEAKGSTIELDDAIDQYLVGLRIYGKTTQNGTPTPDSPVDLLSVGDSGNITVNVTGNNDAQSMTVLTPNGLPGIPVATDGNYTDANGQQWICDEIDFVNGTYIKRIDKIVFDGSADESWKAYSTEDNRSFYVDVSKSALGMHLSVCSHFENVENSWGTGNSQRTGIYSDHTSNVRKYFRPPNKTIMEVDQWNDWLSENPTTFVYVMANVVETPLSEEELAAYASLHTCKDHITVSNDTGAWMELEYVMDAKKYIDSLVGQSSGVSARLTSVTLLASKWVGADSLYSQVVAIDGITEYSKVDLLPSMEQLAIFRNKDVAFVTENEDGVVTVYAIGDKPILDYTMQAQITEVGV